MIDARCRSLAIDTFAAIASEDCAPGEWHRIAIRNPDIALQSNDSWQRNITGWVLDKSSRLFNHRCSMIKDKN
jgi:hypothetical protein